MCDLEYLNDYYVLHANSLSPSSFSNNFFLADRPIFQVVAILATCANWFYHLESNCKQLSTTTLLYSYCLFRYIDFGLHQVWLYELSGDLDFPVGAQYSNCNMPTHFHWLICISISLVAHRVSLMVQKQTKTNSRLNCTVSFMHKWKILDGY